MIDTGRTTLGGKYNERSTTVLYAIITDTDRHTDLSNASSVLTKLVMTLYEATTLAVVNSCNQRNVLNANGGTVYNQLQSFVEDDGNGNITTHYYNFKIVLSAADMACLLNGAEEGHIALIEWTWGAVTPQDANHELAFIVRNLAKVA